MKKYFAKKNKKTLHKILLVHHATHFSGAENSLLHLVAHLDREKFRPIFMSPGKGEFAEKLVEKKIQHISYQFGRNREILNTIKSIKKICQFARYYKIDLIHSNGPQTNIPAGLAGRWIGIPVIWHARNLTIKGKLDIDKIAGFLPQRILCNSEAIRARFKGLRTEKIAKTIINGVDLKDYDPKIPGSEIKEEFGIPLRAQVLGMTSRLSKEKGHMTLFKALAHLKDKYRNLWAFIVGGNVFERDAHFPDFLRKKAFEFGIADRTVFTGFRDDVARLYSAMDIFILATNAEPCGRVIFEAMAMKKPVIGTSNGGTPEIVKKDQTGLLYNYGDVEELVKKIDYLLQNPNVREIMGSAGRKRIENYFTIDKNVQSTEREYISLLEDKK